MLQSETNQTRTENELAMITLISICLHIFQGSIAIEMWHINQPLRLKIAILEKVVKTTEDECKIFKKCNWSSSVLYRLQDFGVWPYLEMFPWNSNFEELLLVFENLIFRTFVYNVPCNKCTKCSVPCNECINLEFFSQFTSISYSIFFSKKFDLSDVLFGLSKSI